LIRVILYQKLSSQYHHKEFFGTPLVLSIPASVTYRQLYKIILHRLSNGEGGTSETHGGVFRCVPPSLIRVDTEHFKRAQEEGRRPQEDELVHTPRSETEKAYLKAQPSFDDYTVFEVIATDIRGDDRDPQPALLNDDLPFSLKDRQTLCCLWPQKHFNYYFDSASSSSLDVGVIDVKTDLASFNQTSESNQKRLTLDDCLRAFAAEEQLAETDTWYCSECS